MNEEAKHSRRKQDKSGAGLYLTALFAIALLLLLMAHFMQMRTETTAAESFSAPETGYSQTESTALPNGTHINN